MKDHQQNRGNRSSRQRQLSRQSKQRQAGQPNKPTRQRQLAQRDSIYQPDQPSKPTRQRILAEQHCQHHPEQPELHRQDYNFQAPVGAIPFMRLVTDEFEPDEQLFAVDSEMMMLSPWAMRYIANDVIDDDSLVELLAEFWCVRGDRIYMPGAFLMLCGLVANHPDFSNGVEIEIPIVEIRRATRGSIEITEHGPAGLVSLMVVHDLLVATTESGLNLAFYSDDVVGPM